MSEISGSGSDTVVFGLIRKLFHILVDCVKNLQSDLQVKDVTVNHGASMQDAVKVLKGSYVASDAIRDVKKTNTSIIVNLYISSVGTHVRLETYWPTNDGDNNDDHNFDNYVCHLTKIVEELYYMLTIMYKWCGKRKKHLYIMLFLFNAQKIYPKDAFRKGQSVGPEHVNSGFSYIRPNTSNKFTHMVDIVVYRKEEVLKVMKHEIIHVMGMHSTVYPREYDEYLKDKYNIKSLQSDGSLKIFEGYVEFLSLVLNTFMYSYNKTEGRGDQESDFLREFEKDMNVERTNSLRLLGQMSQDLGVVMTKENASATGWMFKKVLREKTSVFSYYFIKAALLADWKDSIVTLQRMCPRYAVDDDAKMRTYFELVCEKLKTLTPKNKSNLPRKPITNIKMSFHDRL